MKPEIIEEYGNKGLEKRKRGEGSVEAKMDKLKRNLNNFLEEMQRTQNNIESFHSQINTAFEDLESDFLVFEDIHGSKPRKQH